MENGLAERGRLRGMAARLRAAAGGRPSPAANAESVGEERQAGTEAEAAVPQKNRQSSARKALFWPSAEVQKASAVLPARGASIVFPSVRKTFPPFPAGERGGTSRLYEASGAPLLRMTAPRRPSGKRRGFLPVRKLNKNGSALRCELWAGQPKNRRPACRRSGGWMRGLLRAGKNRARAALLPCPADRRASGFCFPL